MQCNGLRWLGRLERTFIAALSVRRPGNAAKRQIVSGASAYCYSLGYAAPCHVLTATQVLYLQTFLNCIIFSEDEKVLSTNTGNTAAWLQVHAARGRAAERQTHTGRDTNIYQVKSRTEISLHCPVLGSFVLTYYYLSLLVHTHPDS